MNNSAERPQGLIYFSGTRKHGGDIWFQDDYVAALSVAGGKFIGFRAAEVVLRKNFVDVYSTCFGLTVLHCSHGSLRSARVAWRALMRRIVSPRSTYIIASKRPRSETPSKTNRSSSIECLPSFVMRPSGSAKTVVASSKETPCLAKLLATLCAFHSKFRATLASLADLAAEFTKSFGRSWLSIWVGLTRAGAWYFWAGRWASCRFGWILAECHGLNNMFFTTY